MHKTPIGLTLAACLLLSMPSAFKATWADAPASAAPQATRIMLQHIVPSDILTTLRWDQAGTLPAGVSSVFAQTSDNALVVIATPIDSVKCFL